VATQSYANVAYGPDGLELLEAGQDAATVVERLTEDDPEFGEHERAALSASQGTNNFENHDLAVVEDALARGWGDADGEGQARLVDTIWHGLQSLGRA
jgi:uncharacterized Ntn-hydrolase superfamily protein